jgi:BirA family biotin operon repressor/biotin-[acetyl-CoA-carboxylase] ligase
MAKLIREQIIRRLASGDFISGEQLGADLGVSRAAISKHIKALTEIGLDIFRVTGKGYKLANPLTLLQQEVIKNKLTALGLSPTIEVHNLIDSTNSYLMRKLQTLQPQTVCLAEYQSAGRGRRGRQWHSPFGSHIYLSLYWRLEQGLSAAMGISLVVALAVSKTLEELYQLDVQLKWPNDIYLGGKKLAGILIELEGQSFGPSDCVIGLGLNIAMPEVNDEQITQPWTDVQQHLAQVVDRNELSARLVDNILTLLKQHQDRIFT